MNRDPYASPQGVAGGGDSDATQRGKQIALIGIPLLMLAAGIFDHDTLVESSHVKSPWVRLFSILINISGGILAFLWYRQDAAERGFHRTIGWNIGIIVLTVIVFPWYLLKSRGAKNGLKSLGWSLAFVVVGIVIPYFVGLILPHALQLP